MPHERALRIDAAVLEGPCAGDPPPLAGPGNLAYVLYTSGSTGRPKGVAVEHRSPVELVHWAWDAFSGEELDGVLASTSICFDLSVFELFVPLSRGGTVLLAENALELPSLPAAGQVTLINTVPSAMSELAEGHLPPGPCTVNLAGEPLQPELVRRIYRHEQVRRVLNLYGPSEDTTYSTWDPVEKGAERVTIGRPLHNTRAHLVDRLLQPVPVGVPGELCLEGAGLARGYLGRPDLTASRFVPAPLGGSGERLYRTGDLARRLLDGRLEFLGRLDHQVKIRGFRIELGEVESVLAEHSEVREAVVVARDDLAGGRALVAYVVARPEGDLVLGELRSWLRSKLPASMVPAFLVLLQALPRTPNGKVDRRALPRPLQAAQPDTLAPRTPVEELVAGIWADLLGLDRVGPDDNLFELGAHSLLAMRFASRLRQLFGCELPLRHFFQDPTVTCLAARLEAARESGGGREVPSPLVRIAPELRERPLPLSFAQQRLWFIDQLEPGSPLYNMPVALRAEGPLDCGVLALTLGEIVRRHEGLRTVFAVLEGSPVQAIQAAAPFILPVVDLSGLTESRREAVALSLAGEEAGRPFDLARGPLLRGLLLRLAGEDHVAALTLHHIASDGWSMGILVRELATLYAAFAQGRPSPLPELPVQYADFAVWQRSWLNGERLENEISFWRRQLAGLPPWLELPTDRPRPATQSFRGATRLVRLPAGRIRQVQALSRDEGATLFMVLLAALQALLARYSRQQDLAVGSPIAGRNRAETEGVIGFFVNTLVLRGEVTGGTFRELLGRTRETALAAYAHQDVPFEKLVEELAPERSLAHAPLFQMMLVLQNAPAEALELQSLRLRPAGVPGTTAKFDLTLSLGEHNGELSGGITYATDLFDAVTIDRLTGHFERLLTGALESREQRLSEISLLTSAEHEQVVVEWNDTTHPFGEPSCVHHLIAARVAQAPEAEAVVCAGRSLSFGELGRRAAGLARRLREQGVGPEVPVVLFLDRSVETIVALAGVLAAGGAYVPVDPTYPPEWVAWVLADSRAPVVVTTSSLAGRLPAGTPTLLLEEVAESDATFDSAAGPDHPAYLIYTSGSTGRPKGVVVRHGSLMNLTRALREMVYRDDAGPLRVGVNASFAFDGSVKQIVQLAWGHCLHILPQDVRLDPVAMVETVRRQRLDVLDCTPSLLRPLLQAGLGEGDAAPAMVLVGGEAVDAELRDLALTRTRTRFWNVYGPTECTVDTVAAPFAAGTSSSRIGLPLSNVRVYVADSPEDLAPLGVPGELQVGGAGLARGYLGRPDLTAERFIPDSFGGGAGERLYRTGDLVRWLPDGSLDFLGRLDHQVKIRGFRIELGEIEAVLAALPAVRKALVVAREDTPGARRLVAYVVGEVTADALRRALRERLPEHMVPAAFVMLAELPLTPNGKVDRKALPAPDGHAAEKSYQAPRTPMEQILARIWSELLDLERVGVDESFFDLGGHSLLATRLVSQLRNTLRLEVPLRTLFEAPTVAELARRVTALQSEQVAEAMPIRPVPRDGELPLSYAQQRLWFLDRMVPDNPFYNVYHPVELSGTMDVEVLRRSFHEIARRHEVLRTTFDAVEGRPVQAIAPEVGLDLPLIDLQGLHGERRREELSRLSWEEGRRPFNLLRGPMLRLHGVRLEPEHHALLVTMHHIATDGWSM
ncbi:MAG TPA: amino acid adenylation domain-containing protein, partial [Thermoanaerobaculia bacterium]|nr:amino acid adenylation domain-containing protein [Thermoanaerobaculia bacterium]